MPQKHSKSEAGSTFRQRVKIFSRGSQDATAARPEREHEIHLIALSKNAPEIEVPWNIRVMAAWAWRTLMIVAVAVVLGYLVVSMQVIVIPALIALILTVALEPLKIFLVRRLRFPRALAAITTILVVLAAFVGLLTYSGRSVAMGFDRLANQASQGFEQLLDWLTTGPFQIGQKQIDLWMAEIQKAAQDNAGTLASGALSATSSLVSLITGLTLVIFLVIFFLMDGRRIWTWIVRLLPPTWRVPVHEASIRSYVTLAGYVKATVLVALIDAIGIAGGAFFLNVQLWLPIGVLVFLFSFVPLVGALLSGAIAVLVALVDVGFGAAVIMVIVVLVVQQIEGNILQPFIMGTNVSLHPVAVLLGVAAGTYIAGIAGAVFAVPILAFLNTFLLYLSGHDKYPRLATDPERPGGPPGTLGEQIRTSYGYAPAEDEAQKHEFLHASASELNIARGIANVVDPAEAAEIAGWDAGSSVDTAASPEVAPAPLSPAVVHPEEPSDPTNPAGTR